MTPLAARKSTDLQSEPVSAIRRGEIVDWEVLESVLYYGLYEQLGWIEGGEGPLLLVDSPLTSRLHRERLCQMAFEVFNVQSYYTIDAAVSSLYAIGKLSGLVVDIGYEKIDVSPVLDGLLQTSNVIRLPYGGNDLTLWLQHHLLQELRGLHVSYEAAEDMKKKCMHVRVDGQHVDGDSTSDGSDAWQSYTLPDGQKISLVEEGWKLGEALLDPSTLMENRSIVLDKNHTPEMHLSLGDAIFSASALFCAVQNEREARKTLIENIFVCGGGCCTAGLEKRLLREVTLRAPPSMSPGACRAPEHLGKPSETAHRAAWTGGALLAKIVFGGAFGSTAQQMQQCLSKADYDEIGPTAVHRKCSS